MAILKDITKPMNKLYTFILKDFILFASLIGLLPFMFMSNYALPSADDFCYSYEAATRGFWGAAQYWMTEWSGRYFSNTFLGTTPFIMQYPLFYKLSALALILFLFGAIFLLVAQILQHIFKPRQLLAIASLILLVFIASMPTVVQGFYWFNGAIVHMLGLIFYLYLLGYLILYSTSESKLTKFISFALVLLMVIFASGTNETITILVLITTLFGFIASSLHKRRVSFAQALFAIISIICTYITFTAPGNMVRLQEYAGSQNLWFTITSSLAVTWKYATQWLIFTPVLPTAALFYLIVVKKSKKLMTVNSIAGFLPFTIFANIAVIFFLALPSFWGQGAEPVFRSQNIIFMIFFLLMLWNAYLIAIAMRNAPKFELTGFFIAEKRNFNYSVAYNTFLILTLVWTFAGILFSPNVRNVINDIYTGKGQIYLNQDAKRHAQIKTCLTTGKTGCVVSKITVAPDTTFNVDITNQAGRFMNQCAARYYGLKTIVTDQ